VRNLSHLGKRLCEKAPEICKDPADRKMGPYGMIGLKVNDKAFATCGLTEISRETASPTVHGDFLYRVRNYGRRERRLEPATP